MRDDRFSLCVLLYHRELQVGVVQDGESLQAYKSICPSAFGQNTQPYKLTLSSEEP